LEYATVTSPREFGLISAFSNLVAGRILLSFLPFWPYLFAMSKPANIVHSDAIVLRSIDYGETSRIVTLFTRERGKIGVMAKGARANRSRFGSTLEPLSHINVVLYYKPGRDLQIVSEASHVHTHDVLRSSLDRIETGLRMLELTSALLQNDEAHPEIFGLLAGSLSGLENAPGRTSNIWPFYQLRLATHLGFGPSFEGDFVKMLTAESAVLNLKTGDISLETPSGSQPFTASRAAIRAFAVLARSHLSDVVRMDLSPVILGEVNNMVAAYLKFHVEDAYPHRSSRVFAQLATK
jgi:DNA repair protein RecO (recombination protein O)